MNKWLLLLLLLTVMLAIPASGGINTTFTPVFDKQQSEPAMIICIENSNEYPITNVTANVSATGLDISNNEFSSVHHFNVDSLQPGEQRFLRLQFKFPKTNDDIGVNTIIQYHDNDEVRTDAIKFTIPAIVVMSVLDSNKTLIWITMIGAVMFGAYVFGMIIGKKYG